MIHDVVERVREHLAGDEDEQQRADDDVDAAPEAQQRRDAGPERAAERRAATSASTRTSGPGPWTLIATSAPASAPIISWPSWPMLKLAGAHGDDRADAPR